MEQETAFILPLPPSSSLGAQFTVKEPSSRAVPTGGNVSLSCSSPSATLYYWWVGAPPNRAGITASGVSLDGAWLNISSFHAADHAGLYSCMVALPGANAIFTCPANISHASEYHTYLLGHEGHQDFNLGLQNEYTLPLLEVNTHGMRRGKNFLMRFLRGKQKTENHHHVDVQQDSACSVCSNLAE